HFFTKTNRIARILAGSKKRILTKKPRFLSTFSQVLITWTLVGIQCILVAIGLVKEFPKASFDENFAPKNGSYMCNFHNGIYGTFCLEFYSCILKILKKYFLLLFYVLFCTLYAFKTRNLPENFNEAKFIGFTMYCTLVTWCAFVVLYVNSLNKALTASFTFSLSASIALSLLFFPKCFIILLRPEKNVRSSYTTTKLIRCHFGNAPSTFTDSKHGISFLSKTRNSSQSLSIGAGSCPTRTASLHVVNQNNIISSGGGGGGGGIFKFYLEVILLEIRQQNFLVL
uniref:G-protein coupled receptors family 3 profile domain-containing protein n=1 Tax=Meloidogyne incognita TaxID=6306 RepID=A0A914P053_MELIC